MIEAARHVLGALFLVAWLSFVDQRVVHLLFPAMAQRTEGLHRTAFAVVPNESSYFPVWADLARIIVEEMGLAAEILPVVGILTLRFVVHLTLERAPLCLKVVHVKVGVALILVDQAGLQVELRVSEGAVLSVRTLLRSGHAEFCLVLFNVIQTLHITVRLLAVVSLEAPIFQAVFANHGRVDAIRAPSVNICMVKLALLGMVRPCDLAW